MVRYCGRDFADWELLEIRRLIADNPRASRARLSRLACEQLGWRRADGRLKDMSCRVAMLRMQDDGLIQLPPRCNGNGNGRPYGRRTSEAEPELFPVVASAGALVDLHLDPVEPSKASHLWNEYIARYHYLGYQPLPGAQLRYFATAHGKVLALMGFGAAAWKIAPRDRFIGWTAEQRQSRLQLVVNNARFLLLPWVHCQNLASRLLSMATRRLADDWQKRYGYRPVLVETFVESPRFRGTCYKAANWIYLGETQGRGKLDKDHTASLPRKSIWAYPLVKDFRRILCD
ncbi:MAG: DUF4338 domain-containing protein [Bacillota bacterium]|nr:DUF4338 domain-containing protein [Bacillota bacterium]